MREGKVRQLQAVEASLLSGQAALQQDLQRLFASWEGEQGEQLTPAEGQLEQVWLP